MAMLPEMERYPVLRALSKSPKQRWPDCRSFVEALRRGFEVHAVRQALLADPKDDLLRQVYLSLRTPELREQDRRGVHIRPITILLLIIVTVSCIIGLPWMINEMMKEVAPTSQRVIESVFLFMFTATPVLFYFTIRKEYRTTVSYIEEYGPRPNILDQILPAGVFPLIDWNDPGEDDDQTTASQST
jgi:hypothetical protein